MAATLLAQPSAGDAVWAPAPIGPVREAVGLHFLNGGLVRILCCAQRLRFLVVFGTYQRADEAFSSTSASAHAQTRGGERLPLNKSANQRNGRVQDMLWLRPTVLES